MDTPDFLVAGHVVQDLADGEWRPGGGAAYASLLARNLGMRTAVLTSCADDLPLPELLSGIDVHRVPAKDTTQIRNVYPDEKDAKRRQWMPRRAATLAAKHLPAAWRTARIVLLGPVAGEIDASLASAFTSESLIGAGAQGWLREVGADHRVLPIQPAEWHAEPFLRRIRALFLSDEDIPLEDAPMAIAEWSALVDYVAFTRGYGGADAWFQGEWRSIEAFPARTVDLTGAGDVFAAGFLVRYAEADDPWEATRFASAAASLVIEGTGVEGIPTREQIDERLRAYPRVAAR